MFGELIDNLVSIFAPEAGVRRKVARQSIEQLRSYDAGKMDRTTARWRANAEPGDSPLVGEVQRSRYRAWDLYRNNCYARKAVNALAAHVVGCGFKVESLASKGRNGDSYDKFRADSADVWERFQASAFGHPGRGGMTFAEGCVLAFKEWLLSGECFLRFHGLSKDEQRRSQYPIPLQLELYEAERLIEGDYYASTIKVPEGNRIIRGIEYNSKDERVAYHFYKAHPQDVYPFAKSLETVRVLSSDVLHIYQPSRPSQTRGVSQFAAAILKLKDVADYEYNELVAAAVSACVSLVVKTQPGAGRLGFAAPSGGSNTDKDGNQIDRVQPGMILRLSQGEEAMGFNPARPNAGVDGFVQHMLRGVADSLPGLKSSTLTADYRNSSFSSERSADNDCWREIEQVQEFFFSHLCQPVYERCIEVAVESGALTAPGFESDKVRHLRATWNGPVAKSINPVNDENASKIAIETGNSTLQIECAARGFNWRENLEQQAEEKRVREKLGLPLPQHLVDQTTEGSTGGKDAAASTQPSTKSSFKVFADAERECFEPDEEREDESLVYEFVR